jgi:membrane protein implicated in regulation of membrane protease activity
MSAYLDSIVFWHWFVVALVLGVLEMFLPGVLFLWLGIAAAVVGLILTVFPGLGWEWQLVFFTVLSIASVVGWHRFRPLPVDTDQPNLNRRGEQYVGRVLTLDEAIVNGVGKVQVDDSTWKVNGADADAGARVRVTGARGTVLQVAPAE